MVDNGNEYSQDIRIINYSKAPIYLVDSSEYEPMLISPSKCMDPNLMDSIVMKSISACTPLNNISVSTNDIRHNLRIRKIVDVPSDVISDDWNFIDARSGLAFFISLEKATEFWKTHKSAFDYFLNSNVGTIFKSSANFGILNCTGKDIYVVDDIGIDSDGVSRITPIPSGKEPIAPLYLKQNVNNMEINKSKPYIRIFRGNLLRNESFEFYGSMSEAIKYWIPDELTADGFMYIESINVCIFDDEKLAEAFINTYGNITTYVKRLHAVDMDDNVQSIVVEKTAELQKAIEDKNKEIEKANAHIKKIMIGCGIILSLNAIPYIWGWIKNKTKSIENKTSGLTVSMLTSVSNMIEKS